MDFEKYGHLSEDAQRLMGLYAIAGVDSNKRMDDLIYLLTRYCFRGFNGIKAVDELVNNGILKKTGKDWYTNSAIYEMPLAEFVLVLCYIFEKRKDLLIAYKKTRTVENKKNRPLILAVQELVDNHYRKSTLSAYIDTEMVGSLMPVVDDKRFMPLLQGLPSDSLIELCQSLFSYYIENDIVKDTSTICSVISTYPTITETIRYRLLALYDLYNYIATGQSPVEGVFQSVLEGKMQMFLTLMETGNYEIAHSLYMKDIKLKEKAENKMACFSNPIIPFFHVLGCIHSVAENKTECLSKFIQQDVKNGNIHFQPAKLLAKDYLKSSQNYIREELLRMFNQATNGMIPVGYKYFAFLLTSYFGHSVKDMILDKSEPRLALLRHEMSPYILMDEEEVNSLNKKYGKALALSSIPHTAAWQTLLDELTMEMNGEGKLTKKEDLERLVYVRASMDTENIIVKEQKRLKNGQWSAGKVVSDIRYRNGLMECMNDVDRRILANFRASKSWYLQLKDVVVELIGSDRLYYGEKAPYENIMVDNGTPYLIVEKEHGQFVVKSNVSLNSLKEDIIIIEDSPTHYSVVTLPEQVKSWYYRLLSVGSFPLSAEDSLREFLPAVGGKIEVHSSLIEGGSTLPIVDGNSLVGFKLRPRNNGTYNIEVFVRPLPGGRCTYPLGKGDDVIIDENEDGRVRVRRNLAEEKSHLKKVKLLWEEFADEDDEVGDVESSEIYPPEFVLNLIQYIQSNPDFCYAEWPEGQSLKVRAIAKGSTSWDGVVKARGQWFEIEGDVQIDSETVLSISNLLELIGKSHGRFVQLGDGEFLMLSEKLKKQLKSLESVVNRERGKIKISPFSAAVMNEEMLNGEISFTLDKKLVDIRKQIIESSNYSPEVPDELNATLRPYQVDGYQWIARLNKWGAGALLADDMGLGKTIQTIAYLLLKKEEGPSLVVAPASVVPNWKAELEKFAPNLNSQILNFAIDRRKMIDDAKAGDVIITTYGILLSIQEYITAKEWNVACLDEAHIIKNRGAKTSAAAMKIQANNRVMLTGTPVQNHLGELWSLFQFVNPGLLGGYENFSQKFIVPIEGYQDKERQGMLDNIVHPFMLRRTKQGVLKELPEKTEIYYPVELSNEEMAIYESIRMRAEKMLETNIATKSPGSEVDMNVLAEITRLRQASCSAQLIEPKWSGESSKVTTLVELLQGVTESGNRALVFSQFVSFFEIVKRELDKRNVTYFYIDGSVSVKKRTEMVNKFQEGENSVFLISLKAGGLGLNLTGANYVIHLDPWWNPAIEQQATDRAYRIGQQQAVTVYHLVSKNTIEEKIIRLHQTKRDLADSLLEGTDISHKITGKDLLEMVRG